MNILPAFTIFQGVGGKSYKFKTGVCVGAATGEKPFVRGCKGQALGPRGFYVQVVAKHRELEKCPLEHFGKGFQTIWRLFWGLQGEIVTRDCLAE